MKSPLLPILALVLLVTACTSAQTRRERFIQRAETLAAQREYAKARVEFRNALQIDEKDTRTLMRAAEMSEKLESFKDAVMFYQAAIKVDPANNRARAELGRIMVAGGLAKETLKLIDAAPSGTRDADLLAVRGAALQLTGDMAGALREGEKAIQLAPGNENAASLLVALYSRTNRNADALRVAGQALKLTPGSIALHEIMAQLKYKAGDRAGAEEQLRSIIPLEPENLGHRYHLAQFYLVNDQVEAAEQTLSEAVAAQPEDVAAKLTLANVIASHRSFADGEKELKRLIAQSGNSLPLQMGLGEFYATHGHADEAMAVYRGIVAADDTGPQGLTARNRMAAIELRNNRGGESAKLVDEVLKSNPRDHDALIMRAEIALSHGDAIQAITDLRAVLRDDPDDTSVMRTLAQAYLVNQDKALAEEILRKAISANPSEIATRLALARLLIDNNRADEAQTLVDQLANDRPGNTQGLEAAFRVQMARNDLGAARSSVRAIRAVDPQGPLGFYLAGVIDEYDHKPADALENYEKALAHPDAGIEPLSAAVRIDLSQKHPDKALARLEAALTRSPRDVALMNLKGEVLSRSGRTQDAIVAFEHAIQLAPKWWPPYRGIALAQLGSGNNRACFAAFQRGLDATHAMPLLLQFAATYERAGQPAAAIDLYESWLRSDPASDLAANNLAMLLVTYKAQDPKARDRALELTRHFGNSPSAALVDTYGWVRYIRGEFDQAVTALKRAVELAPAPLMHYHLGMAQFRAGQNDAARQQLNLAVVAGARYDGLAEARQTLALLGPAG